MSEVPGPARRTTDAEWLRDRIARLLLRRCRLTQTGPCPDDPTCALLRRALDRAIVDDFVLLHALATTTSVDRRIDWASAFSASAIESDPGEPSRETW